MSSTKKPATGGAAVVEHRLGLVGRLLKPCNGHAAEEEAMRPFMNRNVSRRSLIGASASLAAIAMPVAVASAEQAGSANLRTLPAAGVHPELQALKKAFDANFRKYEETRKPLDDAERRSFAMTPPKPEYLGDERDIDAICATMKAMFRREPDDHPDIAPIKEIQRINKEREEAWLVASMKADEQSGLVAARKAHVRHFRPTDRAADRIFRFKARSFEDILVKFEVHRKWVFEEDLFVAVLSTDINRIAKAQRAARERVDA